MKRLKLFILIGIFSTKSFSMINYTKNECEKIQEVKKMHEIIK
jgi:hypothetical protein